MAATYAYLAGMLDGEGCISLYRRKCASNTSGYSFAPYMRIAAKDKWFLERLRAEYGGYLDVVGPRNFGTTEVYQLCFPPKLIRVLLPEVLPHLILKRREAELLIEALNLTKLNKWGSYDPVRLNEIADELKQLKKERAA